MTNHSRRILLGIIIGLLAILLWGCGGHKPTPAAHHLSLKRAEQECPAASDGHGAMGACTPRSLSLKVSPPLTTVHGLPSFVDLSNNDPCYCGTAIRRTGHVGLIAKANQGTGFIDQTAAAMVASARRAGLAVGEYDFDQDYTIAEARVFVSRLHAAGIWPDTRNTFPAILDVEFGAFSLSGLRAQIKYLQRQGYRVAVYTGGWYWQPHAGCTWVGVPAWLAGYPSAPIFCGLASHLYVDHQFTDKGIIAPGRLGDVSVHLTGLTAFKHFVNNASPPGPTPQQQKELHALIVYREQLRHVLIVQHCRVKHPNRHCRGVLHSGDVVKQRIRALEARGVHIRKGSR